MRLKSISSSSWSSPLVVFAAVFFDIDDDNVVVVNGADRMDEDEDGCEEEGF